MSQFGETAISTKETTDPGKSFTATILAVSFDKSYKACREGATIAAPHWPAKADGYRQSKKAAVLQLGNKNAYAATVKVKVESEGLSGKGTLIGRLENLHFTGEVTLTSGTYDVEVTLKQAPSALSWIRGRIFWQINAERNVRAGATFVELFFIFGNPASIECFRKDGVWIKALRFIFEEGGLDGIEKADDSVRKVTQCCFKLPNHRYNIVDDEASEFIDHPGNFKLKKYMEPADFEVNSLDQSCAVITFAAALGLKVNGLHLSPFGYLQHTRLVGRGWCNNPFPYSKQQSALAISLRQGKTQSPEESKEEAFLVVAPRDPCRRPFVDHTFCEFNNKIFDAAIGPALGQHNRLDYMKENIAIGDDIPEKIVTCYDIEEAPIETAIKDTGIPKQASELSDNLIRTFAAKDLAIETVS